MGEHKKIPLGFDWDILAKVSAMFTAGIFSGVFWLIFRIPETCIMFVLCAILGVMTAFSDVRWADKIRTVFFMALFAGIFQFVMTMLIQEKYLLLLWMFFFPLFLLRYWSNRVASTMALATGALGIAADAGFQPGADRFINLFVAASCGISALALIEYVTIPLRIQITLRQYLTVLIMQMEEAFNSDARGDRVLLKMKVLKFANRANALIASERFLRVRYIAMAFRGQRLLERFHRMSRAMIILENASAGDLENNRYAAEKLIEEMCSAARQIDKCETIKCKVSEISIALEKNMASDALRIIASELSEINGRSL